MGRRTGTTTNTEGGANTEEYHFAAVVDRVNTTMQVWMGTTFGRTQCHHHYYDPWAQLDGTLECNDINALFVTLITSRRQRG